MVTFIVMTARKDWQAWEDSVKVAHSKNCILKKVYNSKFTSLWELVV